MNGFVKHIGLLLYCFFSSILLYTQNEFSYRVINENVFTYNLISEDTPVNPDNLLELSELETINRFFPIGTFKKDRLRLQAEPRVLVDPISENVDFAFNELYVRYGISEAFYVTFGKERINWGTGTVWNPSNPFLQKDPFRLDNRLEGIFLTNLEYILPRLTLNVLFAPSKKIPASTLALKATSTIKSFDYSFNYAFLGNGRQQFACDFNLGMDNFTFYGEGLLRNFSNTGLVYPLGNITPMSKKNSWENVRSEFVLGTMLNTFIRTLLIMEYRYRSDFNTKSSIAGFTSFLPLNLEVYDPISMGRHSFFSQISYTDRYSKYNVNTSVFFDPITQQLLCSPGFIYNGENIKLEINPLIYGNSLSLYDIQGRVVLSFFL
ncbi:MAG: hypothetical protein AAF717_15030 [Bacteroidota bacterium]